MGTYFRIREEKFNLNTKSISTVITVAGLLIKFASSDESKVIVGAVRKLAEDWFGKKRIAIARQQVVYDWCREQLQKIEAGEVDPAYRTTPDPDPTP